MDASTGEPLAGIHLAAQTLDWANAAETWSGLDGWFAFTGLEDKPHFLSAFFGGETIYYSDRKEFAANGEIWTVGDAVGKQIIFRVARDPIVAGVVEDEFGDPVANANVDLHRAVWQDGRTVFASSNTAITDDRGRFRIRASAGSYILCARRDKDAASEIAPTPGPVDFLAVRETHFYRRNCSSQGPPVGFQILPGQIHEVKLTLASGSGASVRGHVIGGPNGFGAGVQLFREDFSIVENSRSNSAPGDGFRFDGVEPGHYRLQANWGTRAASQVIQVEGVDISDLDLKLEDKATIEVLIRTPGNATNTKDAAKIGLRAANSAIMYGSMQPDESYRLSSIDPGTYWLLTRTEGFCVESARFQGQEVLQRTLQVSPGLIANLNVTLSATCSTIQGHVFSQNHPLPFANVTVLLSGSPKSPGDVFIMNADKDGEFTIDNLPPGRYLVWAWGRDDPSFVGPPNLASVENQAAVVTVGPGQTATTAVLAILPPGAAK